MAVTGPARNTAARYGGGRRRTSGCSRSWIAGFVAPAPLRKAREGVMRIGRVAVVAAVLVVFGAGSASASAPPGSAVRRAGWRRVAISAGVEVRPVSPGRMRRWRRASRCRSAMGCAPTRPGLPRWPTADGSRTRFDVNTEFEVVSLTDDAGNAVTRTQMGLGRTWNRVESLGSTGGGFVVETSQATATVRGTAFLVSCLTLIRVTSA